MSRVAVVTGATGPIGAAISRALAQSCPIVVGLYRDRSDRAEAVARETAAKGGDFRPLSCDLAEEGAPYRAYEAVKSVAGPPDVVVLAAGMKARGSALFARADAVRMLFSVNVLAQIEFGRLALKDMMKQRQGRVVVIGSRAASTGVPGQAAYAASKAALSVWAASVAGEVGSYGVTVNVVAPGAMEAAESDIYTAEEQRAIVEHIACRRLGTPDDVASAVTFLASPEAAYISGTTLAVDGGARF